MKTSKLVPTTKSSISSALKEAKRTKSSYQTDFSNLDKEKAASIQQVQDFTERQVHRLRKLETAFIEEINSKHKELKASTGRNVDSLSAAISNMEQDLKKLDRSHSNEEASAFVDAKLGKHHEADGQHLLQRLSNSYKSSLKIIVKADTERFLNDLSSLGSLADDSRVYNAKLNGVYNAKTNQDTSTCSLLETCQLPDGTLMIADWNNSRLKHLDASYSVTDNFDMPDRPYGVTRTASYEVAVTTLYTKKVRFVSVRDSMCLTRSFSTNEYCRGICFSGGQLFVACGGLTEEGREEGPGHVAVFSLQGVLIRHVQTDPTGQQILKCPAGIYNSLNDQTIYIADRQHGVKILDNKGSFIRTISDPSLKCARGVCPLDNGHFLVSCRTSNTVMQFDGNGRKVAELLKRTDGLITPLSLFYDNRNSRLLVTMYVTDIIKVFDLKYT